MKSSYLLLILLTACTTAAQRLPASSGADGQTGSGGQAGSSGHAGTAILATGCSSFLGQSVKAMHASTDAEDWQGDGGLLFMCGDHPAVTPDQLAQLHDDLDAKYVKLLGSGYFPSLPNLLPEIPRNWEGLKEKVARLGDLFRQLENEGKRDRGCVDGSLTLYGRMQGKARVCFHSEIRFVDGDGTVATSLEIAGTIYDPDGKLGKYPHFRESFYTNLLPPRCANNMLELSSSDTVTSNGKELLHKIRATCSSLESTYSSERTPIIFTVP